MKKNPKEAYRIIEKMGVRRMDQLSGTELTKFKWEEQLTESNPNYVLKFEGILKQSVKLFSRKKIVSNSFKIDQIIECYKIRQ